MSVPILFTIPNFVTAGSGRAMYHIVKRLDRARFEPHIAIRKTGGALEEEIRRDGVPIHVFDFTLPARPRATLPLRLVQAARPLRRLGFQLWHSFHWGDDYTEGMLARLAGARWLFTKKNMSWGSRAWEVRSRLAWGIAAQNSEMMTRFFTSAHLTRKARLIPRGVDTDRFRPGVEPRLRMRAALGIPADAPVLAVVAQMVPRKNHPVLLHAMTGLPGAHAFLAGQLMQPDYVEQLRALRAQLGLEARVHIVDAIADVPALLAESDVFVLPTRSEGNPVALLEAMACGKPCVTTATPGSGEIVEHERSGLTVPSDDADALRVALERLLGSPELRARLGTGARARVLERYSIDREVQQHVELYEAVLAERRRLWFM